MKSIFVATDFSPAARSAALYAAAMARAFNAKLTLFHTFYLPVPGTEPVSDITFFKLRDYAEEQLAEEAASINPKNDLKLSTYCIEGLVNENILIAAQYKDADIIICGMKGSGKSMRRYFGSTATFLARHSKLPVLVVPETAAYVNPTTIALASDIHPETDPNTLNTLKQMAELFHSKLYVVHVIKDQMEAVFEVLNRPGSIGRMMRALDPSYEYPRGSNISGTLNHFVEEHHVNILAMIPHKHNILERWFLVSNTKEMLFETTIPVLILPEKKLDNKEGTPEEESENRQVAG